MANVMWIALELADASDLSRCYGAKISSLDKRITSNGTIWVAEISKE
jgi:hypothetical protein